MARYIDAGDLLNALKEERKNGNFVFTSKWIKEIMDKIPTADVVPKSEVESIITLNSQLEAQVFEQRKEIERLSGELKAMRGAANSYKMYYEKAMEVQKEVYRLASEIKAELPSAKAELAKNVASEIFAEIEKALSENFHADCQMGDCIEDYYDNNLQDDIAKLKKKYTEGEQ